MSSRVAILGASGRTGQHLVRQALERGHEVVAILRDPSQSSLPVHEMLTVVRGDVFEPNTIEAAVSDVDVAISALGYRKTDPAGTLAAGARALGGSPRLIWLGALGTGQSRASVSALYVFLLTRFVGKHELADKVLADEIARQRGATIFHAGILGAGPLSPHAHSLPMSSVRKTLLPATVARATVASAMLDEVSVPSRPEIRVPFE